MKKMYKKLRGKIITHSGTYAAFSEQLTMTRESLSYKLNGHSKFTPDEMIEICKILEIPKEEYLLYFIKE